MSQNFTLKVTSSSAAVLRAMEKELLKQLERFAHSDANHMQRSAALKAMEHVRIVPGV